MKTILKIKGVIVLIFVFNLQSVILNQQSYNLYAQDPQLFEHTWYFVNGELNGESFVQPFENHIAIVSFSFEVISICYQFCDECISNENIGSYTNDNFIIPDDEGENWLVLIGFCNPPESDFIDLHNSVYFYTHDVSKNPFSYTIETVDDYYQLTITNGEGDYAIYNSVLLTTPSFNQNSFTLYPNPAEEILFINNNFQQEVNATIYNLKGKLVQSLQIKVGQTQIEVKQLKTGLYFMVFENETGQQVSKKFVKQ